MNSEPTELGTAGTDRTVGTASIADASHPSDGGRFLIPVLVILMTMVCTWSLRQARFVYWQDDDLLVSNTAYQGLSADHLEWMFTDVRAAGHYQPLTWLSYALDFVRGGADSTGFHTSTLIFHALAAWLFYACMLALLRPVGTGGARLDARHGSRVRICAGVAALCFSVHPLRIESVGWLAARGTVLAGVFALASLLFYLKSHPLLRMPVNTSAMDRDSGQRRCLTLSVVFFACSLLSRTEAVLLPLGLMMLDAYLIRRRVSTGSPMGGKPGLRLRDKLPFLAISAAGLAGMVLGRFSDAGPLNAGHVPFLERVALYGYGLLFYVYKTLLPFRLMPFYERPVLHQWNTTLYFLTGSAALVMTLVLWFLRRRLPAFWSAWIWYALLLAPVPLCLQYAQVLGADRYTYLACMPFAALAGGILLWAWRGWADGDLPAPIFRPIGVLAGAAVLGLALVSSRQAADWKGPNFLWAGATRKAQHCLFAHTQLGLAQMRFGRVRLAATTLDAVLEEAQRRRRNPGVSAQGKAYLADNQVLALSHLAGHYARTDQVERATQAIQQAMEYAPDDAELQLRAARLMLVRGQPAQAVPYLVEAVRLDPHHPRAHAQYGAVLDALGFHEEAAEQLRQDVQLNPRSAMSQFQFGLVLSKLGRLADAVVHYQNAVKLDPQFVEARFNLGLALLHLGRSDDSIEQFEELLTLMPDAPSETQEIESLARVHKNLADAQLARGLPEQAMGNATRAGQLAPGMSGVQATLGDCLLAADQPVEALKHYKAALKADPEDEVIRAKFEALRDSAIKEDASSSRTASGRSDESIQQDVIRLEELLENQPGNTDALIRLADLLRHTGRLPEAQTRYEQVIALEPGRVDARLKLADVFRNQGRNPQAEMQMRLAIQMAPDMPDGYWVLGEYLRRAGRRAEAVDTLRAGSRRAPNHPGISLDLAWLLATSPEAELRDGEEALKLATRCKEKLQAAEGAQRPVPRLFDVLAASQAETGDFENAVISAGHALFLAEKLDQTRLSRAIEQRLELYGDRQPYHEVVPDSPDTED